jgi:hypothetical protein
MKKGSLCAAISLAEILICMGMMSIILGCLLSSSLALQKTLQNSERYAGLYSDQHRLMDFIGRDLRRAVTMSATDAAGLDQPVVGPPIDLEQRGTLTVMLPGYYQSDVPTNPGFDTALPVVPVDPHMDYGTVAGGPAKPVKVTFRKIFVAAENSVCFVREEAADRRVIVRKADDLHAQITISEGGRTAVIKAWYLAKFSRAGAIVSTYDTLMLRNNPLAP